MTENQLNDNKTKLFSFPFLLPWNLPDSITLGSHNIPFSDSARNLGFILDSKLSMKKHIIEICQTAFFFIKPKRISSIHSFLTEDAAKSVVTSYNYILSGCDDCSCLLMGTPNSVIQPLQKINSKLCCKTHSLGTPSPPLNTSPVKTALASHFRTY